MGCIVALSGCKNENGAKQAYFNAKVLEVNKEYVDVRCIETFNSGISVDEEFSVTKDVVSAGGAPELNVDDNIRVVFNGDVMENDNDDEDFGDADDLFDDAEEVLDDEE